MYTKETKTAVAELAAAELHDCEASALNVLYSRDFRHLELVSIKMEEYRM